MSVFNFKPSPDLATREQLTTTWENGFNDAQIADIIRIGEALTLNDAVVGGQQQGEDISHIRKSKTSWIKLNDESKWLYELLADITTQINGQFYDFELSGFIEDMQYTVYNGDGGDHYSWHIDKGIPNLSPRKLSIVVQLSDPSEYEGGDLEFFYSASPMKAIKKKGLIYIFPSWMVHRVTPVTSGTRRSLVVWAAGPKFR